MIFTFRRLPFQTIIDTMSFSQAAKTSKILPINPRPDVVFAKSKWKVFAAFFKIFDKGNHAQGNDSQNKKPFYKSLTLLLKNQIG